MELDWLIFPNNGLGTNTILTSSSSSSSSSTLPSPPSLHPFEAQFPEYIDNGITPLIPILRNTTSCDSTDYLHVFDDDDDIDVEVNRHEREHHIDKRLNHEKKEQSSITRHIFKSEKVISSHATSPTSNWTEQAIEQLINNIIDPIGKFLRDLRISPADAIQLEIMPLLDRAPRKARAKYGKRKEMSPVEKAELNRERNREHAKSTRMRRKIFEKVLDSQLSKIKVFVGNSFSEFSEQNYLARREIRIARFVECLSLMNSQVTIQHRTKIVKIFLQYCIPSQATSGAESGNHPKVNSIRPYFLARRLFTGDTAFRDMALFLLHLLQIEIPRCTNPLFVSQFDENTIEISTPKVVRVSQTPKQFISNVPSSPWLHQSLTPTLAHVVNSEDSEKNQTMDSIQSTQDFEMISSLYVPHLSPKDLESMWDCHERINTAPEDGIISSNPFGSSDNHQNNHSTNDILTPQTTDGHESPINSQAPRSFPIPIGLHLTINSDDNDLLIQGRQGIGSFDISILSSDMTTVSLAVSGQLIHFTFEDSSVLTVPSTAVPVPPNTPINDVLTTCHIHLDIHSLALGYIQAIRKRIFESNIQGSDNTSTEPHG